MTTTPSLVDRTGSSLHVEVGTFTDDIGYPWLVMRWRHWCWLDYSRSKIQSDPNTQRPWRELRDEFREQERLGRSFSFHIGNEAYYAVRLIDPMQERSENSSNLAGI